MCPRFTGSPNLLDLGCFRLFSIVTEAEFYSRRKFVSGFFNFPAEVPPPENLFNFPAKETAAVFLVTSFGPGTKEDSFSFNNNRSSAILMKP